jgi:hypothetical protein
MKIGHMVGGLLLGAAVLAFVTVLGQASSHREAPFITELPKVDGTDFYMFRSYEPGRESFVTIMANYLPLQDAYGGPNYFFLDPEALYEIHIDNNGDAREDLTFQFRFQNNLQSLAVPVGEGSDARMVPVPLLNIGPIGGSGNPADRNALNLQETYTVTIVRGDRRTGTAQPITNATATAVVPAGASVFVKPVDNIGAKSLPDYEAYARAHVYNIDLPGCTIPGSRLFVGQRRESFVVNLGETFDLINFAIPAVELAPAGVDAERAEANTIDDKNITSLILEVPIACLTAGTEPVIGGWTTASLRQARVLNPEPGTAPGEQGAAVEGGAWTQVSRLGSPLVNELVIGLPDKDRFNASKPVDDAQFAQYVTHPTLPELVEVLFGSAGVQAPNRFPRDDLVAAFLTGIASLNQPANVQAAEMLRLNTSIPPTPRTSQQRLGVLGGDNAGFPNGRRPGDDVVDIELRVAMGRLITLGLFGNASQAPSGGINFTDGAFIDASMFEDSFPYLTTPLPGSPSTP